jgi:hypothetical protein
MSSCTPVPKALAIAFGLTLMASVSSGAAAQGAAVQAQIARQARPPDEPARRGSIPAPRAAVLGLGIVLAAASAHALLRVARDRGPR